MTLRRILERTARGLALKRRMPPPFERSSIIISPDSQLKYLKPGSRALDPMLLRTAKEHITAGMRVWDVGANVGVFSVAAATLGATVVAFEPDVWLASLISKTARLPENRHLHIDVVTAAVSNIDGIAKFSIAERGRASNALQSVGGHSQMGGVRETKTVPTLTLDTLLASLPAPDFLKVDVEGAELLVLQGGRKTLRAKPRLLLEVSDQHSETIAVMLTTLGYSLFDAESGAHPRQSLARCSPNTLAIASLT